MAQVHHFQKCPACGMNNPPNAQKCQACPYWFVPPPKPSPPPPPPPPPLTPAQLAQQHLSTVRTVGIVGLCASVAGLAYFGLLFDTSVAAGQGGRIVNLGLMNDRIIWCIIFVGTAVVSAILLCRGLPDK